MSRALCPPEVVWSAFAAVALAAGCLDALGHQETVKEHSDVEGMSQVEDDKIEDKHPTFDPARLVTETFRSSSPTSGCSELTLNKSAAVTKLDIVPFESGETALDGKLFPGRLQALAAVDAVAGADVVPSMEVVNGALKPFNDGLYAAVELAEEADKSALLAGLAARLGGLLAAADPSTRPALEDGARLIAAAQILAGETPAVDVGLLPGAQTLASAFEAMPKLARPIGFYTWTPALERVFTRDRFLQGADTSASGGAYIAVAFALGQDSALLAAYQRITALYAGLTNPYVSYGLDQLIPYVTGPAALASPGAVLTAFSASHPLLTPCSGVLLAFLPASRSKETAYFDEAYCAGLPDGVNLLDQLIAAIQSGAVDLTPGMNAGWYDYQEYALETLLLPERGAESQHLLLTAGYKKKLVETFKSILIQTRETHVKQLATATKGESGEITPIDIYPLFPVEPFPTFYLRTARGYRFLRTFLEATQGLDFLGGTSRLLENGQRASATLAAELDQRVALLYGLYSLGADAVGMARGEELLADEMTAIDATAAVEAARTWLAGWQADADVARDPRVIVPVFYDDDSGTATYWAVVGVKALEARAEFVAGHEPEVVTAGCWTGQFVPHRYTLLVEETAEVTLASSRPPPTRDELRAICDAHATKDEIVRALEAP